MGTWSAIIESVSSALSRIPVGKRQQLAGVLGLFAVLFVAIGAVAATGADTAILEVFVAVAFVVALVLALIAWGVVRSITLDTADRRVDAIVEGAVADAVANGSPAVACGCGHVHDPDEMHVTDDPCAHDGTGVGCTHSCDTCVLARLRTVAPTAAVDRPRPSPSPR